MKIVEPTAKLLAYTQLVPERVGGELNPHMKYVAADPCTEMARIVEQCGRVSWKSEAKMTVGSADDFMVRVVNLRKDESIAEHCSATILLTTDRYCTHQLVRHRIAAYTQESTHYIQYGKTGRPEMAFCRPLGIPQFIDGTNEETNAFRAWRQICEEAEQVYLRMVNEEGIKHYNARFVLPGSLKTDIAITFNLRMWRHVFKLRCTPNNTPEIVHAMKLCLGIMYPLCPPMFDDLAKEFLK
jgi:thymidylate synthase (FAD)